MLSCPGDASLGRGIDDISPLQRQPHVTADSNRCVLFSLLLFLPVTVRPLELQAAESHDQHCCCMREFQEIKPEDQSRAVQSRRSLRAAGKEGKCHFKSH